jgi:hypothetical protein
VRNAAGSGTARRLAAGAVPILSPLQTKELTMVDILFAAAILCAIGLLCAAMLGDFSR